MALCFFAVTLASAAPLLGCPADSLEADRQAMLATVTPCPPPATCTATMKAARREVSVCSPAPDALGYRVGDVVVVKELGVNNTLARVTQRRGNGYAIELARGVTSERSADRLIGRLCR